MINRYQWMTTFKCNSLSIDYNEHACNYVSARQWIEDLVPETFENVDPHIIQRMKETNTIWRFQLYPDTPIGFYVFFGSTLDEAIDQAIAHFNHQKVEHREAS